MSPIYPAGAAWAVDVNDGHIVEICEPAEFEPFPAVWIADCADDLLATESWTAPIVSLRPLTPMAVELLQMALAPAQAKP